MTALAFLGYPDFWSWLHDWAPIVLMALLVFAVYSLLQFMPKTRPAATAMTPAEPPRPRLPKPSAS
jgi:hypothetical protein